MVGILLFLFGCLFWFCCRSKLLRRRSNRARPGQWWMLWSLATVVVASVTGRLLEPPRAREGTSNRGRNGRCVVSGLQQRHKLLGRHQMRTVSVANVTRRERMEAMTITRQQRTFSVLGIARGDHVIVARKTEDDTRMGLYKAPLVDDGSRRIGDSERMLMVSLDGEAPYWKRCRNIYEESLVVLKRSLTRLLTKECAVAIFPIANKNSNKFVT